MTNPPSLFRALPVLAALLGAPALAQQDAPELITVLDIAHSSTFSNYMTEHTVQAATTWLVNEHLSKAASKGVAKVIIKNPYRWLPSPAEDHRFGGTVPARRAALHDAIAAAKAAHLPMPRLCVYQSLPSGAALSPADATLLNDQLIAFDEDAWDASIGCQPWQQALIDARNQTRPQHLEPIWDRYYTAQWGYPIDGTEDMLSWPITQWQLYPDPRPEIRASFYRPVVQRPGESGRAAMIRTIGEFRAYCFQRKFTPVDPMHAYTMYDISSTDISPVTCLADYDGNAFVSGPDFDAFTDDYNAGSIRADVDGNWFVTGDDFDLFTEHYLNGC